jgi:hypothetical protein
MNISFGKYRGQSINTLPEIYLCWMCATYKGGYKAKHAGEKPWDDISEGEYLEARRVLKDKGYDTKGVMPIKI